MPNDTNESKTFAKINAIQVRIDENVRMMAQLHARWKREEELAKVDDIVRVCTITTTENNVIPHASKPPTINGNIIGVGNVSSNTSKKLKLPKTAETSLDKSAEIFKNMGECGSVCFDDNNFDFDNCNISEVIKFLQKLATSPNASSLNLAFTTHITNALIKAREDKLRLEASIPKKLEDGWEPIIKMKVDKFLLQCFV